MKKTFYKNRVQLQNPKSKLWVKVDISIGKILGHKKTPYKNIRKV
ncbi:unnamed protein product [marine sediment metagenome]|uniref:Uncharacterized protein n=1 Tax=marine sediment metagenome TaxID=412755 RepID=X0XU52_9ZZZZ